MHLFGPVALYLALGALGLWLAHRLVLPISPRTGLVLLLLPLCFTGHALLTGRVYGPVNLPFSREPLASHASSHGGFEQRRPVLSDVPHQIIPWRKAVRYSVKQGEWPLWNPFVLSGDPLAPTGQAAPYHPLNLAGFLLPLAWSLGLVASLTFLLALSSSFLYLRSLECRELSALIGGAAWCFSDFVTFWIGWPLGLAVAVVPLVFLGCRQVARSPNVRSGLLLALALVSILLAGHPETAFHVVVVAAAYGSFEIFGAPRSLRLKGVAIAAGAAILALSVASVELLPVSRALDQSFEAKFRAAELAGKDPSVGWKEAGLRMATHVAPVEPSTEGSEGWEQRRFFLPRASGAIGSVFLVLSVFGLWGVCWPGRWFLAGLVAFGALVGAKAPGVYDLLVDLPLFEVTLNERYVFLVAFGLSSLAGLGAEAWARGLHRGAMAALALLLALPLTLLFLRVVPGLDLLELRGPMPVPAWTVTLVPLALTVPLLIRGPCGRRRAAWTLAVVLLLAVGQRVLAAGTLYPALPFNAFYPEVPPLEEIPERDPEGEPFRVVGQGEILPANTATLYELEDVRGYQAVTLDRMADLLPLWSRPVPVSFNRVEDLDDPFLDFLNVRYALATPQARKEPGWREIARGPETLLLENAEALSRAFLPRTVVLGAAPRAIRKGLESRDDFVDRAWIGEKRGGGEGRPLPNGTGTVRVRNRKTGLLLEASLDEPAWLVVSEPGWNGWRAFEGEEELTLERANHAFLGLRLPAGDHEVTLVYRPRSFEWGLGISLIGSVLLLAMLGRELARGSSERGEPVV